jgi:hypothetical protein
VHNKIEHRNIVAYGGFKKKQKRTVVRPKSRWAIILKQILERRNGTHLTRDREQYRALIDTVLSPQVPNECKPYGGK